MIQNFGYIEKHVRKFTLPDRNILLFRNQNYLYRYLYSGIGRNHMYKSFIIISKSVLCKNLYS